MMNETEFDIGYKVGVKESIGKIKELEKLLAEKDKQLESAQGLIDSILEEIEPDEGDDVEFLYSNIYEEINQYLDQFKESE